MLLFEDNVAFATSLQLLINSTSDLECNQVYRDPTFALKVIETHQPDVILMDIDMPNLNGIEAVKQIRTKYPSIAIIMQTVFDTDDKIYSAICAGANGYILKKALPQKYIDAIRDMINGGAPMTSSVAIRVLSLLKKQPRVAKNKFNLSVREKEILRELTNGLSYKMIADKLMISKHTVNSHIRKIYEKLHVHNATEAVSKAMKENLLSFLILFFLFV